MSSSTSWEYFNGKPENESRRVEISSLPGIENTIEIPVKYSSSKTASLEEPSSSISNSDDMTRLLQLIPASVEFKTCSTVQKKSDTQIDVTDIYTLPMDALPVSDVYEKFLNISAGNGLANSRIKPSLPELAASSSDDELIRKVSSNERFRMRAGRIQSFIMDDGKIGLMRYKRELDKCRNHNNNENFLRSLCNPRLMVGAEFKPSYEFQKHSASSHSEDSKIFPEDTNTVETPFCGKERKCADNSSLSFIKKMLSDRKVLMPSNGQESRHLPLAVNLARLRNDRHELPPIPTIESESHVTIENADNIEIPPTLSSRSFDIVKACGWYWGPLSSQGAEDLLRGEPDGSFIVRDSSDPRYIFSLTFKLNGLLRHVRIDHDHGNFSFGPLTRFKASTIVDFVEKAVAHSRSGRFLFFLHQRPVLGPMRVQLLHPYSRFKHPRSLQHMCRFVILTTIRRDLVENLGLPKPLLDYLRAPQYYFEIPQLGDQHQFHLRRHRQ